MSFIIKYLFYISVPNIHRMFFNYTSLYAHPVLFCFVFFFKHPLITQNTLNILFLTFNKYSLCVSTPVNNPSKCQSSIIITSQVGFYNILMSLFVYLKTIVSIIIIITKFFFFFYNIRNILLLMGSVTFIKVHYRY